MTFSKWPDRLHEETDQQKRIKSAKDAKLTPLFVDSRSFTGHFSGSSGTYTTTLDDCQCGDFIRRKKPCKHIYRLAMEMGVFPSEGLKQDRAAIVEPKPSPVQREQMLISVIDAIESTDTDAQIEIKTVLYHDYKQEPYLCEDIRSVQIFIEKGLLQAEKDYLAIIKHNTQKKTLDRLVDVNYVFPDNIVKKKDKYLWCMSHAEEVGPIAYPLFGALRPSGDLLHVKRKVYTYLLRKYDDDLIFMEEGFSSVPHGAEYITRFSSDGTVKTTLSFPEDEITQLLNKYDCNRCK